MNLQHHFLIAMPALQDPIFRRSVVYICEYNEDGAMGIIINKPLENLQVEGILDKLKIPAEARLPEIRLDKPVTLLKKMLSVAISPSTAFTTAWRILPCAITSAVCRI